MSQQVRLLDVFEGKRYQKIVLAVSVVAFLFLELLIYLAAAGQAGQKSTIIVTDTNGTKVYETAGTTLTSYERLVFENTFGPLQNYRIQLETESVPFPFRAWVSAAVGIPIGLVLLVSFLVRVYLSLLYGEEKEESEESLGEAETRNRFGALYSSFRRFSVFHAGFMALVAVLLFWIVPNFLQDFTKVSVAAIKEYKWFFMGIAVFMAILITWVIYLRYRISKQMLDNQLDLEKFRVEKQLLIQSETSPLLAGPVNDTQEQ